MRICCRKNLKTIQSIPRANLMGIYDTRYLSAVLSGNLLRTNFLHRLPSGCEKATFSLRGFSYCGATWHRYLFVFQAEITWRNSFSALPHPIGSERKASNLPCRLVLKHWLTAGPKKQDGTTRQFSLDAFSHTQNTENKDRALFFRLEFWKQAAGVCIVLRSKMKWC